MSGAVEKGDRLVSRLSNELCGLIAGLPTGARFDVSPSAEICYCLELFVPRLLRGKYPEWERESLDGIFVARATKTGPSSAELIGTCILISDQAVTPFRIELATSSLGDSVTVPRLMVGEPGAGPLGISGPPCNSRAAQRLLASVMDRIDRVTWSYVLTSSDAG